MPKKQRTRWIYTAQYAHGHYIRVGYVYNKHRGIGADKIRLQINGQTVFHDHVMRKDEAMAVAQGLSKVFTQMEFGMLKG